MSTYTPPPPKPPEPQIRIIKEGHIPPGEVWINGPWVEVPTSPPPSDDPGSTAANPDAKWLWFILVSAISFILGVGFAEWTR